MSADPAMESYIPEASSNEGASERNQNLPGMGGIYNSRNLQTYHYAGNNPLKYTDPSGKYIDESMGLSDEEYARRKKAEDEAKERIKADREANPQKYADRADAIRQARLVSIQHAQSALTGAEWGMVAIGFFALSTGGFGIAIAGLSLAALGAMLDWAENDAKNEISKAELAKLKTELAKEKERRVALLAELSIQEEIAQQDQERINKRKEEGQDTTEDQESLDKRVESLARQRRILEEGDTEPAP